MTTLVLQIALGLCLLMIALLAASEAALAAGNRVRLRHLLQSGTAANEDQNAVQLLTNDLSGDVQRSIATVTIAANMPLLLAAALTTLLARRAVGDWGAWLSCACALAVVPLFKVTPRLLVSQRGTFERLWWVRPARLLVTLIHPAVALMLALGVLLLRPLGLFPAHPAAAEGDESKLGNAESIRDLVETAQASGVIEEGGRELFESIFDFGDTRVHEVMIPRTDITALALDATAEKVFETLQTTGFSRVPLHEGSLDHIAGILHAKDVLAALARGRHDFVAADLKRDAVYLPESQKIDEALAVMRAARNHLAIVIDEYGGTAGLLTVEDILEELVGEIADEHDPAGNEPLVILGPNAALADASLHTDDLNDRFDLALPTRQFDTVGGFMIEQLGRALLRGDKIELPNALLTVLSLRAGRPHIIRIDRKPLRTAEPAPAPTPHRE